MAIVNRFAFAKKGATVGRRSKEKSTFFKGNAVRRRNSASQNQAASQLRVAALARQRPRKQRNYRATSTAYALDRPLPGGHYRKRLFNHLSFLWLFMMLMGQLPFYFIIRKSMIIIRCRLTNPFFWMVVVNCIFSWTLFIWMGCGIYFVDELSEEGSVDQDMARRFWPGYWIFWLILLHLAISSTENLVQARQITMNVNQLFQKVEIMKMDLTRKLVMLMVTNLVLMGLAIVTVVILFFLKDDYPWVYAISAHLIHIFARPIWPDRCTPKLYDISTHPCAPKLYHKFAPFGLALIIYAIIASRLYTMYFMTMCRVFRNAFHVAARRMEICLQLEEKTNEDKRTDFESMFSDYNNITAMVHQFNVINGYSAATYFFIQLVGFLIECFIISRHWGLDPKTYSDEIKIGTPSARPPVSIKNEPHLINIGLMLYMHLCVTFFSCTYVSSIAAGVCKKILQYNAVLYRRGIVGNREPLERDFVRTMWMNCSHRHPVIVSPARLFGITSRFMVKFLGVTVIFLILMFPLPLLSKYSKWEEEQQLYYLQKPTTGPGTGPGPGPNRKPLGSSATREQVIEYLGDLVACFK